jgi:Protein of unknown function (DUF1275)
MIYLSVQSFNRVDVSPRERMRRSTLVTGNLRDVAEGFYDAISFSTSDTREKGLSQARDLGLICLCFLAGAIFDAWAAPRFGNHSLWFTEPLLLEVLGAPFAAVPPERTSPLSLPPADKNSYRLKRKRGGLEASPTY